MGSLKKYTKMQRINVSGKKAREEFTPFPKILSSPSNTQLSPNTTAQLLQPEGNRNLHLHQDTRVLYLHASMPGKKSPSLFPLNLKEIQCWTPIEKDHFKDPDQRRTSEARKQLMELEAWDTSTHRILHLQEWELHEISHLSYQLRQLISKEAKLKVHVHLTGL